MSSTRIPDVIKRIFTETFTVRDVAESLPSFDAGAPSRDVETFMAAGRFEVVGVRRDGRVVGYVRKGTLDGETCGRHGLPFEDAPVLDDTAPLLKALVELNRAPFLFVRILGNVAGVLTRTDLQKPAVRMWLFGIVTLIEMRFSDLIERHCPGDGWKQYLSEARLRKAEALLAERQRRNQALRVFDCLQFSDKGQIIARDENLRTLTVFPSRRQAEETVKQLEQLRNNLAHAQDILTSNWDTIIRICEFVTQTDGE